MANYIISYDLNGPTPSHQQMDQHIARVATTRARVLETVWYVAYAGTKELLRDHLSSILGREDLLLVVEAKDAAWTKLLVDSNALIEAWEANR